MRANISRITVSSFILAVLLLPGLALAQNEIHHGQDMPADGRGDYVRQLPPRAQANGGAVVQGNGISYHNGPVMRSGVNIYYIWYGDWTQDSTANAILTNYAANVGGSPYFNINTSYGDTVGNVPNTSAAIKYAGSASDPGSLGTSLNDGNIWTLVNNALGGGKLPADPNGVYFVLTAPYVAETSGFLSQYCGWHTFNTYNNTLIKYAFVGNPAASLGACSIQSTGPNGDAEADAMASVIAHELEESATDPQLSAWYDSTGAENADKCAWTFGSMYIVNGAYANMTIGTRNYLIQQNWVNAGGGYCGLSYSAPTTPDFSLSVSPSSQTVTAGQTTGGYTVAATPVNGWSNTVTYTVTAGLPAGALANISGNSIAISTTPGVTPGGSYNFTISGTDGTLTHTTSATLVVTVPAPPSFSITVSPGSQSVKRPGSGSTTVSYAVTLTPATGYSGNVSLTISGSTTGVSLSLSSSGPFSGGSGTSTLKATVTSSAKKGNNTVTVTGTDGTTTKSSNASVRVN
jgi:Phosphate-induced protein 1 conserved region